MSPIICHYQPVPAVHCMNKCQEFRRDIDKTIVVVKKNVLLNQLKRDGPRIDKSFDAICSSDLEEFSELMAQTMVLILSGLKRSRYSGDELRLVAGQLMLNTLNSFCAAVQILRSGYRLQPGVIVRNILESVSVVLHLMQHPSDLEPFRAGKLNVPKTVNTAKKALPPFGQLYGFFTKQFSHISGFHQSLQPLVEYSNRDEALISNLRFLRIAVWHIYVTSELLYHDMVTEPRYWTHISSGIYAYDPSADERQWLDRFLHGPDKQPFVPK